MATEIFQQNRLERFGAEDFETASVRSAAPSYISEAPSYHSTFPAADSAPAYTSPPAARGSNSAPSQTSGPSSMLPSGNFARSTGLPRIPELPRPSQVPQLSEFRIAAWSSLNSNPTARHYQAVAHRRVSAASRSNSAQQVQGALRSVLGQPNEEEERLPRVRPLEDPYLVGEEAAARARRERLARENGDEILIQEDRRWDWFLATMQDWDARSRSWKEFENRRRRRFG